MIMQHGQFHKVTLDLFVWDISNHPAHIPNLAPSGFNFFTPLKSFMGEKRFLNYNEVHSAIKE